MVTEAGRKGRQVLDEGAKAEVLLLNELPQALRPGVDVREDSLWGIDRFTRRCSAYHGVWALMALCRSPLYDLCLVSVYMQPMQPPHSLTTSFSTSVFFNGLWKKLSVHCIAMPNQRNPNVFCFCQERG